MRGKKVSRIIVEEKVKFLNRFMNENYTLGIQESIQNSNNLVLFKDYGSKGTDCMCVGTLSDCNKILQRILKKNDLVGMWEDYINHDM